MKIKIILFIYEPYYMICQDSKKKEDLILFYFYFKFVC